MGCSLSKRNGENNAAEMLSVCRERKRLMKLAIQRRHALAMAHFKYTQCLHSIAMTIKSFRGLYETKFHVIEPIPEKETEEETQESDDERDVCEHFYNNDQAGVPLMQNVGENEGGNNYGWDFFNLFDGWKTEVVNVYSGEKKNVCDAKVSREKKTVCDAKVSRGVVNEKEFFEALKLVEESFLKGSECGAEVSRMLEVSSVQHLKSGLDKFQESPMKSPFQSITPMKSPFQSITPMKSPFKSVSPMKSPFQSISWGRSMSSSSSCRSFFAFSSPFSSTWTDINNECFDENIGMISGGHSLTLGRLYAWESKLYQEVKVGEYTRKMYQQKCWQLKNRNSKCKGSGFPENTKAEARDFYSRIMVSIRQVETISKRIEKLKEEELHPQLIELFNGFMSTWKSMLETHKAQKEAISEIKRLNNKNFAELCNDSHRLTTFRLEAEVQNWSICFVEYLSAQKAYAEALNGWLSKYSSPHVGSHTRGKFLRMPFTDDPPSFSITRGWSNLLNNLPEKPVTHAMMSLGKDMRDLWAQQGDEQLQKRKVDGLTKELDRSVNALKREEGKLVQNVLYRVEYLNERKRLLDDSRKKLEMEKDKHYDITKETQQNTLRVFQSGFGSVFDSLIEFSKGSMKMYADLLADFEMKVNK